MGIKLINRILNLKTVGMTTEQISRELEIGIDEVDGLIRKIKAAKLISPGQKRRKTGHDLTTQDHIKGGHASQAILNRQRKEQYSRIFSMVDVRTLSVKIACLTYYLIHGSGKEFSVVIPNELVGKVFYSALWTIKIPDEAIHLIWRQSSQDKEHSDQILDQWGELGPNIEFSNTGNNCSMLLRVGRCFVMSGGDKIIVSSRALGRVFRAKGAQVLLASVGDVC